MLERVTQNLKTESFSTTSLIKLVSYTFQFSVVCKKRGTILTNPKVRFEVGSKANLCCTSMFGHTTTILESQQAAAALSNRNQCNEQLNFHTTSLAKSLSVQVHIVRMQCFFT